MRSYCKTINGWTFRASQNQTNKRLYQNFSAGGTGLKYAKFYSKSLMGSDIIGHFRVKGNIHYRKAYGNIF